MQPSVEELQKKLVDAISILREAIEISVQLKSQQPAANKQVCKLWEYFLGEFFGYIRKRSRETRQNLLAGISFPRF